MSEGESHHSHMFNTSITQVISVNNTLHAEGTLFKSNKLVHEG